MTMAYSAAGQRIAWGPREAEAALDAALLTQTGLLATLITARRASGSSPFLGPAELTRLVRSQRSLLAPAAA